MLALRPRITEIQIDAFQLPRCKNFLGIVNIRKGHFQVRRCRLPGRFPYQSGLLSGTADQLIVHIDADKINIGIFEAHLTDKLPLAHSELHMDRVVVAEQF
ncbi:hypothetical protein D3C85_1335760 [compost metagenome]